MTDAEREAHNRAAKRSYNRAMAHPQKREKLRLQARARRGDLAALEKLAELYNWRPKARP